MAGEQRDLFQGIEADETCVGGKPRKTWDGRHPGTPAPRHPGAPRGRGTSKTPVIGAVERGGDVVARVAENTSGRSPRQAPIFPFHRIRAANHAAHEITNATRSIHEFNLQGNEVE